jgi:hypothetical protein
MAGVSYSQTFLQAYKKFRIQQIDSVIKEGLNLKEIESKKHANALRKKRQAWATIQINELDTIFSSYKDRKGFDFNKADTITIIYQTPVEAPFSDIIVWSGKDTISFAEEIENIRPFKNKRRIIYKPFRYTMNPVKGYREINERDTIITLVGKKEFQRAIQLAEGQQVNGGAYTQIVFAYKTKAQYHIETYKIPPFYFKPVYRQE